MEDTVVSQLDYAINIDLVPEALEIQLQELATRHPNSAPHSGKFNLPFADFIDVNIGIDGEIIRNPLAIPKTMLRFKAAS